MMIKQRKSAITHQIKAVKPYPNTENRRQKMWESAKTKNKNKKIPQILMGASSSNKLGCCKKISLETTQSCRISESDSWTSFPARPRTSKSRLIISSRTAWSISNLLKSLQFPFYFSDGSSNRWESQRLSIGYEGGIEKRKKEGAVVGEQGTRWICLRRRWD